VFTAPAAAPSAGSKTHRSMAGTRNAASDSGFVLEAHEDAAMASRPFNFIGSYTTGQALDDA
jgi:hypothetical protein